MKTLWKSLPKNMKPNGFQFKVGEWHKHEGRVQLCNAGFHASKNVIDAMSYVDAEVIAKVSVRGKSDIGKDKQAWSEMKIEKAWWWEKEDSVALAIYAAELVIDIYEKKYPNDSRPRKAIEAAKNWLKNPTDKNVEIAKAAKAAWAASAESAAWAAWAASAAESAAESAAWAAKAARAESAAWAASAAESAAWAAWAARAESAAWAESAAESAAWAESAAEVTQKCHTFVINRLKTKKPIQ